jgi:hypothetical protein
LDKNGNIRTAGYFFEGALGHNDFSINSKQGIYIDAIQKSDNNSLLDINLPPIISVSPIELCVVCKELIENQDFKREPKKISTINYEPYNGPFTLINGYKNKITKYAQNSYNAYAIVVNKIFNTNENKLQIKELELYGVYENQSQYLETTYNTLYNQNIKIINDDIDNVNEQIQTISKNLESALSIENDILGQIRDYELSISQRITDISDRLRRDPYTNVDNLYQELVSIQSEISTKSQGIMYIEQLYAASNTESNILVGQKFVLEGGIIDKQRILTNINNKIEDYTIVKQQIDDLILKTDNLKTDFQQTSNQLALQYLQALVDKQSANQRYIDLSLDIDIQKILLSEQDGIVTQFATQLANIRANTLAVNTRIANDNSLKEELISALTLIDPTANELLRQEQRKDQAIQDRNRQITITSEAHLTKDAQVAYANGVTDLVVTLQDEFDRKIELNEGIKENIEYLKSQIASIQEDIAVIERDTTIYLSIMEKNQAKFQLQKEQERYELSLKLEQLKLDLQNTVRDTSASLQEYQQQITVYEKDSFILSNRIQELSDKILSTRIQLQRYKYIPYAIDIKSTINDIQTKISYNINNVATIISNSIILTGMQDEYDELYDQKDSIMNIEYTAKNNLEILKRDKKIIAETVLFILNILLLSVISFIIYSYYPHLSVIILVLIIYIFFITLYIYNITQIVRTKANNNYWPKPTRQISKLI